MKVDVVIPSRNRRLQLRECVNDFQNQSYPPSNIFLIGAFSEISSIKGKNIKHIYEKIPFGKSRAILSVVSFLKNPITVISSADIKIPNNTIETIVSSFQKNVGVVTVR